MLNQKKLCCCLITSTVVILISIFSLKQSSRFHPSIELTITNGYTEIENEHSSLIRCDHLNNENGCLNRNNFVHNSSTTHSTMIIPKQSNRIMAPVHWYGQRDAVICFDSINDLHRDLTPSRFVFIGDSRARQQFFNFLKMIPDYDHLIGLNNNSMEKIRDTHVDKTFSSPLLGLNVSFFWRPKLNEEWTNLIEAWIKNPPYFIVISVGLHHLASEQNHLQPFQERLVEYLPSFRSLANRTQLIWLNQYPMLPIQRYVNWGRLTSENIQNLNNLSRRLLKNSGVVFWDSGNPAVEELARSCDHLQWTDREKTEYHAIDLFRPFYYSKYFECKDMVHPGYAALSHTVQILLNHLCNRFLFNS